MHKVKQNQLDVITTIESQPGFTHVYCIHCKHLEQ